VAQFAPESLAQFAPDLVAQFDRNIHKDQDIEDKFNAVRITRYGFAQYKVYVGNDLMLTNNECNKIKQALKNYQN